MAHSKETVTAIRGAYVHERLDLKGAAAKQNVSYATARAWKKKALDSGDDWDKARAASRQASGGLGDMTAELLEDLALLFQATVEEVRKDDSPPLKKAEALSRMADAYTKTMKAAGAGDSKMNRLTIALETLKVLAQFIAERFPEQLEPFVVILEQFDSRAAEVFGK